MKDVLCPPQPTYSIKSIKEEFPEQGKTLEPLLDEMTELIIQIGAGSVEVGKAKEVLIKCIDSGIVQFGITPDNVVTLVMWNFIKGAYFPVTPQYFTNSEISLTMMFASYTINTN